jgi:alpha-mannosidase
MSQRPVVPWSALLVSLAIALAPASAAAQQKRVYIAPDDHTDYFWLADEATYGQVFLDSLDYYLAQVDATAGNPSDFQSRWNCDGSLWLWTFERNRPPDRFQDLIEKIRSGHVSVPLNPFGVSLGGTPAEAVLRGMYYPGRIERRYDVRFPLAYLMENQAHPLGIASLWRGSGARWSWKGICGCDSLLPDAWDRDHEIYLATGLDGAEVLMKWNSQLNGSQGIGGYAEAFDPVAAVDFVTTQAASNGFLARYPYDVIGCFGHGWDGLQALTSSFVSTAQAMSNPSRRVIVSNEQDFFADFESHGDRNLLPRVAVSFGNEWELYVATLAEPSARVKRALEKLRAAEALAAIESQIDPLFAAGLEAARDQADMNFGLYYEHNFGMVGAPSGPAGISARVAWQERLCDEIEAYVDALHSSASAALGRRIAGAAEGQRYFAFNPLGWERNDVAELAYSGPTPFHVVDVASGLQVPAQLVTTNGVPRIRTLCNGVPSLGYRVYEIRPGNGSASFPLAGTVSGNKVTSQHYTLSLEGDGALSSLIDRTQGGRQFAAQIGGRWVNDLGGGSGSVVLEDLGPVSVTLRADSAVPVQHTTRITLYAGLRRIEVDNVIEQNFDGVETWSFGFDLDQPRVRHEEVGAVLEARLESEGGHYARRNARYDWLTLNHFADISGADGAGVTLSNADCYFFQLGHSTLQTLDTATPRLSVLAGGRVGNGSNGIAGQGGVDHFRQRFALGTHTGYDAALAMRFALEHQNPLVCGAVTSTAAVLPPALHSALTVSHPNTLLWAFKPAEEGIGHGLIARVWNLDPVAREAHVQLGSQPVAAARGTTHIETDVSMETVGPAGLRASLGPHQMRTYRLLLDDGPQVYCTAKTNSLGCTPAIAWSGAPSASAGAGFVLGATKVISKAPAVLLYTRSGPAATPMQGGFLCLAPPLKRVVGLNAGGSGPCNGVLTLDFNAYVASGADPKLVAGTSVHAQFWSRDANDPFASSLTDAVAFTLGP